MNICCQNNDQTHQAHASAPCRNVRLETEQALTTQRLLLRRPQVSDATSLARWLADPQVSRMIARLPQPYHPGDALDWILGLPEDPDTGWAYVIEDQASHAVIGLISVTRRPDGFHLAYWLARPHWGQGLMGEALEAVLAAVGKTCPGARLHSGVMADNPASLRLMDRFGFAVTGVKDQFSVSRGMMVHVITMERDGVAGN